MKRTAKILAGLTALTMAGLVFAAPVKADALTEAKATMEKAAADRDAKAAAGLKSGQAYLDAAKATMETAAKDRDAKAAAGLKSGQSYLDAAKATLETAAADRDAKAAAGLKAGLAYLEKVTIK